MFRRRSPEVAVNGERLLVGLDLNATRVRAVTGEAGVPQPLALDGPDGELAMALSLEDRQPVVGRAGVALCRRLPHLTCSDFLAHLGQTKQWTAGRHRLDAAGALSLVFQRLHSATSTAQGFLAAIPAYLGLEQLETLAASAEKSRLPLLGTVPAPIAAAASASLQKPGTGVVLILDVDDHAMTWAAVRPRESCAEQVALSLSRTLTLRPLGLRAWKQRLLNAIAERCIRHSRRDPRECAEAEQALYDQLDVAMTKCRRGELAEIDIQAPQWYQNFYLRANELESYCAALVRPAIDAMYETLMAAQIEDPPAAVIVTSPAARLPGLFAALQDRIAEPTQVITLPADAVARAAHDVATRITAGRLPRGHLQTLPISPIDQSTARTSANRREPSIPARLTGTDR